MTTVTVDRIQGLSGNLAAKVPCRVATTGAITLSGTQTIDGVAVAAGDRVLVKGQASSIENGIYDVSATAWTRAADFDGTNDVVNGTLVPIAEGTAGYHRVYMALGTDPILPGSSAITFSVLR